jgi:flagellar basal-body rod modification protein FlgD
MITNVNNSTAANGTTTETTAKSELDKDAFLSLLVAQMQNQNPLEPMDNTEYIAQLAQFSSLEQMNNMNDLLSQSIDANYLLAQSINNTMAANYIGKEVKLSGDTIQASGQESYTLGYNLPSEAKSVTVEIYDKDGHLVRTIENASTEEGDNTVKWDMKNSNGKTVSDGDYTYKIKAKSSSGDEITATQFLVGTVSSVKYTDDGTKFVMNGVEYDLSDVIEIYEDSTEKE